MNITVRFLSSQAQKESAKLRAEMKALEAQVAAAGAASGGIVSAGGFRSLAKWGSQLQWAGRQLQANFTLPIIASGAIITKWSLENEAAMLRIKKVYGDASNGADLFARDQQALGEAISALSEVYAVQRSEVAGIAGDWAAAGATAASLAIGVESTLKTMVLGEMEAAEATEALIAIQAQYGASSEELINIVNTLNATENATGTTFEGLVQAMSRSAGAARSAGVDVEHLSAMIAALTPAAGTAANAGNALKTMISRVMAPTNEAAEIMGKMGVNIEDMSWKSLSAVGRIEALALKFHELEGASDDMVSAQAAQVSATIASRWNINRWDVLMRDIYNSVHAAGDANGYYGRTLETLGVTLDRDSSKANLAAIAHRELRTVLDGSPTAVKRAGVVIQNSLMKALAAVLPQILWMIEAVSSLAQSFANLDPSLQKFIMGALGLLAILGPPMVMLGSLAVAVGNLGQMFKLVTGGFGKFISRMGFGAKAAATAAAEVGGSTAGAEKVTTGSLARMRTAWSSLAGSVKVAAARTIVDMRAAAAATASTAPVAVRAAGVRSAALVREQGVIAAWRAKVTANAIAANGAWQKYAVGSARAASTSAVAVAKSTATGMTRMSTAVKSGTAAATTSYLRFTNMTLPSAMERGTAAASSAYLRFTNMTLPGAMERGMAAANMATYRGLSSMTRIMGRSLMENLAVANSYVNGMTAAAARGATQIAAAGKVAQAAAITSGSKLAATTQVAGASAAARVGTGFTSKLGAVTGGISKGMRSIGPKVVAGLKTFGPAIGRALLSVGRFFTGPIGLAITGVMALLYTFRDQIAQVFKNVAAQFADTGSGLGKAWQGIVKLFNKGRDLVVRSFRALPEGIQGALKAVVGMVRNAAMAVYKLFSYMNPFQRHSPSLVENVTNGMKVVGDQFGLAVGRIKSSMMEGYRSLKSFGGAVAGFMKRYQATLNKEERNTIVAWIPKAVKEYDRLKKAITPLEKQLEKVSRAIEKQEKVVASWKSKLDAAEASLTKAKDKLSALESVADSVGSSLSEAQSELERYASSPIEGMREMGDAIFDNEIAQKKLRLEMLKMGGDGTVEDLQSRLASLAGEIETIRGQQQELQRAGAGSDITGVLEDQIRALEGQQDGAASSITQMNELQKALEELEKQGQILDLTNSITYDPLIREVEQLATAYTEMSQADIIAGITKQQQEIVKLEAEYKKATSAVDKQKAAVDREQKNVDKIQAGYDKQQKKLEALKSVYDSMTEQLQAMTSAIEDVVRAAGDMERALEATGGKGGSGGGGRGGGTGDAFDGAAGGAYPDVGDSNVIGSDAGDLDAWLEGFLKENASVFAGVDFFGGIKSAWSSLKGWWTANVTPIWNGFAQGMGEIFGTVDWMAPFRGLGDAIGKVKTWFETSGVGAAIGGMVDNITKPFGEMWTSLVDVWNKNWPGLKNAFDIFSSAFGRIGGTLGKVGKQFSDLASWLAPVVAVISGIIYTGFGTAWTILANTIAAVVPPIFEMIVGTFKGIVKFLSGVIDFFGGIFTGDWDKVWTGIKNIFGGIWDMLYSSVQAVIKIIVGTIQGFAKSAMSIFNWLYKNVLGPSGIAGMVGGIVNWFKKLPGQVMGFISGLINSIVGWFKQLPGAIGSALSTAWTSVVTWFTGVASSIGNAILTAASSIGQAGMDLINNLWSGIQSAWTAVSEWFLGLGETISSTIGDSVASLVSKGIGFITGLWNGVLTAWAMLKTWFQGTAKRIIGTLANAAVALYSRGREFLTGLWNGVKAVWTNVSSWFGSLWSKITGAIGNVVGKLVGKGRDFLTGLWNGVKTVWSNVSAWFGSLWSKITGAIGNVVGKLQQKGKDFIAGLKTGIEKKWEDAKTWLAGIGTRALTAIGDLSKTLWNMGSKIISGLWEGLKSKWKEVEDWFGGIGKWIDSWGGGKKGADAGASMGTNVASGFTGAFRKSLPDIERAINEAGAMMGAANGIVASGPSINSVGGTTIQAPPTVTTQNFYFYGDLEFPNVNDGSDAKDFLDNLDTLAGGDVR